MVPYGVYSWFHAHKGLFFGRLPGDPQVCVVVVGNGRFPHEQDARIEYQWELHEDTWQSIVMEMAKQLNVDYGVTLDAKLAAKRAEAEDMDTALRRAQMGEDMIQRDASTLPSQRPQAPPPGDTKRAPIGADAAPTWPQHDAPMPLVYTTVNRNANGARQVTSMNLGAKLYSLLGPCPVDPGEPSSWALWTVLIVGIAALFAAAVVAQCW